MIRIDHEQVARLLDYRSLIDKLDQLFVEGCTYPPRAHHRVPVSGKPDATLLLMPSWSSDGFLGVKIAAVFPGNREVGLPSVSAEYLLMNATDGTPLALIDGSELTARRTAATSALAADLLARSDARSLLVVGTGRLSRHLARAHLVVRPHLEVTIWGRNPDWPRPLQPTCAGTGLMPDLQQTSRPPPRSLISSAARRTRRGPLFGVTG